MAVGPVCGCPRELHSGALPTTREPQASGTPQVRKASAPRCRTLTQVADDSWAGTSPYFLCQQNQCFNPKIVLTTIYRCRMIGGLSLRSIFATWTLASVRVHAPEGTNRVGARGVALCATLPCPPKLELAPSLGLRTRTWCGGATSRMQWRQLWLPLRRRLTPIRKAIGKNLDKARPLWSNWSDCWPAKPCATPLKQAGPKRLPRTRVETQSSPPCDDCCDEAG